MFQLRTFPCPTCTLSIVAHLGSSTLWTILALRDTKWSLARMHTMRMIRLAPPFPLRAGTSITAFSYCPSWPTSPVRSLAHRTSSCLQTSSTVLSPTNLRGSRLEHQYTLTLPLDLMILITRAHLRQVEYCHALTLPLAQMIHITWALLLTESEFSCVPPVPQLSLLLKSLSLLANVASQGSLGCC